MEKSERVVPPAWYQTFWKVVWTPMVAFIGGISLLTTAWSLLQKTILSHWQPPKFSATVLNSVAALPWQTWVAIWSVVLILVISIQCHLQIRAYVVGMNNLIDRINELIDRVTQLEAANSSLKQEALEGQQARREFAALQETARTDAARRLVDLSVSLKTEQTPAPILVKASSQFSGDQALQINVYRMSLAIYNHGEKPARLKECKLWKLHGAEAVFSVALHDMVIPDAPKYVDITGTLIRVILANQTLSLEALPGKHTVRIVLVYSLGGEPVESKPYDFELSLQHGQGAPFLIDATEVQA